MEDKVILFGSILKERMISFYNNITIRLLF